MIDGIMKSPYKHLYNPENVYISKDGGGAGNSSVSEEENGVRRSFQAIIGHRVIIKVIDYRKKFSISSTVKQTMAIRSKCVGSGEMVLHFVSPRVSSSAIRLLEEQVPAWAVTFWKK